jgi:membrane fusion protein, multidrug efflux system
MSLMQLNEKRYRRYWWAGALAVVAAFFILRACRNAQHQGAGFPGAPEVGVITVKTQRVVLTTELPGRTAPYRIAEIRPRVSGLIQKRRFTEGSDVREGDLLYQIDPAPFQAALDNAEAALNRAQANLPPIRARAERFKELLSDKSVSQQDYDDAEGALKQAEAEVKYGKATVETARINLEYTRITSPISGRIGRSTVTDGAIVTAYQPVALAVVQQLDPIYVDVAQSTSDLLRLQKRTADGGLAPDGTNEKRVHLILEDKTTYPLEGILQFRDISVDPSTASVVLRMVFPNPKEILLPGMFVQAVVEEGADENAILIPQQAVSRGPKGNPMVMIVDESTKAQPKMIAVDKAIGDQWLVTSGLAPGDSVIVEGIQRVRPSTPVRAVPFISGAETPPLSAPHTAEKIK